MDLDGELVSSQQRKTGSLERSPTLQSTPVPLRSASVTRASSAELSQPVAADHILPEARQASDPEDATCGEALEISQARTLGDDAQHAPSLDWFSEPSPLLLDHSPHREHTPNTLHHDSEGEDDSDSDDEAEPLRAQAKSGGTCSPKGSCPEGSPCDWCACYPKLSAIYRRLRENVAENSEAGSRKARTGGDCSPDAPFSKSAECLSPRPQ